MGFIKNHSKLLAFILVATLTGGGTYYYAFILSTQIEELQFIKDQNEVKRLQLQHLEQEYYILSERKKELINMEMEVQALRDKVLPYNISVIMMMEIMQYMEICNFEDTEVSMGEPFKQENDKNSYYTIPITIIYTTTYDNTLRFLEEINRSYQMITVDYFAIDNSVQEVADKTILSNLVKTEIILSLYYRDSNEKEEYPNFIEFFNKEENIFARHGVEESKGEM